MEDQRVPFRENTAAEQTDTVLYALACRGDEDAVEALLDRYRAPLTSFVRSLLHDRRDTEEVVVDAFAELCASRGRFGGKSSLKTYLFAIARHLAFRRRGPRRDIPLPIPPEAEADSAYRLDHTLEDLPRHVDLLSAMARLPTDQRLAVNLLYLQGMSYREAAEVLGKNDKQVAHLAARGKAALRKLLDAE